MLTHQRITVVLLLLKFLSTGLFGAEAVRVLDALVRAYPGKITGLAFRDGDWSILVDGQTYYWAQGRMLSAENRSRAKELSAYSFRPYPDKVPPIRRLDAWERSRLERFLDRREAREDLRHPGFIQDLWDIESLAVGERTVYGMKFLGHNVRIHPDLVDSLLEIERELVAVADQDLTLARWIENLAAVGGFVWRDIANSANRSLHSYGIAIDLIPADYNGKQAYWLWARDHYKEWWTIPHDQRYPMPQIVVEAFEKRGFIWGGKWLLFDQIHFEYRPELILLREAEVEDPKQRQKRLLD